ncbi:MAG: hypothetical protein WCB51_11790 [Candidatus Dormiibacterota bacterium]
MKVLRTLVRVALIAPLLGIGLGTASAVAHTGPAATLCVQAGAPHRAGIVVEHGDGGVVRRCVGFATPSITAIAVLEASGIENGTIGFGSLGGAAVCQIDNEPASYPPGCFTGSGSYWELFVAHAGGSWTAARQGASLTTLADGGDVGFRYNPQAGPDPPPVAAAGTCPPATPTPVPASVPPSRAATPRPNGSPVATLTPGVPRTPAPTEGVLGLSSPAVIDAPGAAVPPAAAAGGSINAGLLTGACGAGVLIGLLGLQLARRRRR